MNALMQDLLPRHRIDVDQYYRLAEEGVLAPEARVELIDGEIIDMPSIGSPHSGIVARLNRLFNAALQRQALVGIQSPVRLDRFSEPQPDLSLLRNREDDYTRSHPSPADVLLLVEVSDSRLKYDLDVKVPLYARFGISEVWVVVVGGYEVCYFRSLKDGRYTDVQRTGNPGMASLAALPGIALDLTGLLRVG